MQNPFKKTPENKLTRGCCSPCSVSKDMLTIYYQQLMADGLVGVRDASLLNLHSLIHTTLINQRKAVLIKAKGILCLKHNSSRVQK